MDKSPKEEQYKGTQEKYLRIQKLEKLASNVKRIQETATELQESIGNMTQVEEATRKHQEDPPSPVQKNPKTLP